ncbi:MAG: P-loop NTPase fold protein [Alphaproteobacteria bacterium]|nr:P-loop NTPase fold protein [Alphaproteobacteria bacterium]
MTILSKTSPLEDVQEAWEADCLNVKKVADYLTPVIGSIRQPFVISLNAPYGTGKTFFIRNWQKDLSDQGYKAVYFNAWETDYTDNALVAFISLIDDQLRDGVSKTASLIKAGAGYIAQKGLVTLAKGIARKCIGNETVKEIVDLVSLSEEDIAGFASTLAEDAYKKHKEVTKSVEVFKEQLGSFVQQLSDKADHDDKKKLIIFVDELDRCRPTYAVEVLECIKHLFNIPGIVFILAIDIDQLKATIAKTYGAPDDGEGYLRKFIDWQLNLPRLSSRQFCEVLYGEFGLNETGKFTSDRTTHTDYTLMMDGAAWVADVFGLSLRTLSQVFTDINLCVRHFSGDGVPFSFPLGCLAALRHVKDVPNLKKCCDGDDSVKDILKKMSSYLETNKVPSSLQSRGIAETMLEATFMNSETYSNVRKEWDKWSNGNSSQNNDAPDKAEIKRRQNIEALLNSFESLNYGIRNPRCSIAMTVFQRLEKASFLTEKP